MRRAAWAVAAGVVVSLAALPACGTRVSNSTAGATGQAELGVASSPAESVAGPAEALRPLGPRASAALGASRGASPAGTGGLAQPVPRSGRGTTGIAAEAAHGPVPVGILNVTGLSEGAATLGLSGFNTGDMRAEADSIVRYVNAHGGVLGRPIRPVYFTYDFVANSSSSYDSSLFQAACSRWTEDAHVIAAIWVAGLSSPTLPNCLDNKGAGLFVTSVGAFADRLFNRWHAVTAPMWASMERGYDLLIRRAAAYDYFPRGVRVGLVRFDRPDMALIQGNVIEPALKRVGVTLTDWVALHNPSGTGDIGTTSRDVQGAIVRFRAAGIDHVIFEDWSGLASLLWLSSAQSQGYTARYAVTSDSRPQYLVDNGYGSQLRSAIGVGWNPSESIGDTAPADNPLHDGPDQKRCAAAAANSGQDMSVPDVRQTTYQLCDLIFGLRTAVGAAGDLSPGAVARGLDLLPRGFAAATTFATSLTAGRRIGAASARDLFLDPDCTCFRYRGPVLHLN